MLSAPKCRDILYEAKFRQSILTFKLAIQGKLLERLMLALQTDKATGIVTVRMGCTICHKARVKKGLGAKGASRIKSSVLADHERSKAHKEVSSQHLVQETDRNFLA